MILSLCPVANAQTDVIGAANDFIKEHGSDPDGNGKTRYCADMKGGGTFNISLGNEYIECWIENSEQDGESFFNYKFSIVLKPPYDSDIVWGCLIADENGQNTATGKMPTSDNINSELVPNKYDGDDYLYKSFMENAHNFRDALILAIANDLNYYFDKNLDYFGINPQFFCPDGHAFGEWVYQKNATKQANGTEKRQCADCFATEEREVEGTMIQVPAGSVEQTPEVQPVPDVQHEDEPEIPPEIKPLPETEAEPENQEPDYQFELETPDTDTEDKEEKPKKAIPPYALPLGIALAVIVAVTVAVLVVKTKQGGKQTDDDDDLFKM